MRHLLTTIIVCIIAIVLFTTVNWDDIDFAISSPTQAETPDNDPIQYDETDEGLWVDTLASANGHSFGYSGDVTDWDGWYYDTILVGDDIMLKYDSVGPTSRKLSLVARELIFDFNDPDAPDKIKQFLSPLAGFKRFQNGHKTVLDSIVDEEYGTLRCYGYFTFTADYADTCLDNFPKINRFICNLTGISKGETAKVPDLSAFYAGFNPVKYYRPAYTGNENNMQDLSDFLANKAFENWKRGGDMESSSNEEKLDIRAHVANPKFVTFSKYEYERIGIGHGMYTETFHTLDLASGKALTNKDIFKSNSLDMVKKLLFETMFNDKQYREWNDGIESPDEIEAAIEDWQSPSAILEGTEWEEPKREVKFELPEGALTETGVVFSFQPYEIDCWAAGAFHFIVPYSKLRPHMTSKAKTLCVNLL